MNVRKVIRKRIRKQGKGTNLAADVNVVVSSNVNDPGSRASARSRQRIVQRSGTVSERPVQGGGEGDG